MANHIQPTTIPTSNNTTTSTSSRRPQQNLESLYTQLRWTTHHTSSTPMSRRRRLALLRSYLPDWIITILLTGLLAIINNVHGFRREFSLTDTSIQHTYAIHERVPTYLLGILAILIPALIIIGFSLAISRSVWDLHNGLLGFVLANALTLTITTIIKVTVGRPRPDLIDRCQPFPNSHNAEPYGLVTDSICSVGVNNKILRDGFRSFPSGHASTSFSGFTYLSLYLAGKLHLFDKKGHAVTAWLCITPLMAATLIAISRTMDYRHHATDVIAGALLGATISYWSYKLYYPSLRDRESHKPFSPRIPKEHFMGAGEESERFEDDDEEREREEENRGFRRFNLSETEGVTATAEDEDEEMAGFVKKNSSNRINDTSGRGLQGSLDYPERETVPRI